MKILMLGNSLTTAHDLPELLGKLTGADIAVHARGGARLAEHLNPSTRLGALTQQALADGTWDYVVLQEMSNGPVRFCEKFLDACARLAAAIRASGAEPLLYATWAYAPDCSKLEKLGMSHEQMNEQLSSAYHAAAEQNGALIATVGDAFFAHPSKAALYAPDGVHPSPAGTQLAAQTLAAAIQAGRSHHA